MNVKTLQYVVTIADCGTISKAAEQLYISRSALNTYLLQLEQELGTPLFNRVQKRLVPTYAGELYVSAARKILNIQEQLYKEIGDIALQARGRINLGVNRSIGEKIIRETFPTFHEKYPGFSINLTAGEHVEKDLVEGRLDWAIMGYGTAVPSPPELEHDILGTCEVVLALPASHPLSAMAAPPGQPHRTLDLRLLREDAFILLSPGRNARRIADERFAAAGFTPNILMECNGGLIASQMVRRGLGPAILVETLFTPGDGACCFSLDPPAYWTHTLSFRKGTVFSKAEQFLLGLVKSYLKSDKSE